jgi:hypothetical protein
MTTDAAGRPPLTAAQVEVIQQLIEERQERLRTEVQTMIETAVDALHATLVPEINAAIPWGAQVALRAAGGQVLCATHGGPSVEGQPFTFESRTTVGPDESFVTERGRS